MRAARHAFDGGDGVPIMHCRQGHAGIDAAFVHQHGASAALPMVAAFPGAGQQQPFAQGVEQRDACIGDERVALAVHGQQHRHALRRRLLREIGRGCGLERLGAAIQRYGTGSKRGGGAQPSAMAAFPANLVVGVGDGTLLVGTPV